MGRGSGSITQTMALIAAVCLLWVYPICLFHEGSAGATQGVSTSDLYHGSSSPALCDDHQICAALSGRETDISANSGVSLRIEPLRVLPHEWFSVVRRRELAGPLLPASRSASLSASKGLCVLYAVYQI